MERSLQKSSRSSDNKKIPNLCNTNNSIGNNLLKPVFGQIQYSALFLPETRAERWNIIESIRYTSQTRSYNIPSSRIVIDRVELP